MYNFSFLFYFFFTIFVVFFDDNVFRHKNDDDYVNNEDSFNVEAFVIDKILLQSLQIKDKHSRCYMYEKVKRDIFLQWWKSFIWAKKHTNQDKKKKRHLYWKDDKKSDIWNHFDEDVILEDEVSKIICKRCELVMKHSFIENETHTAKTHLSLKQCVKIAKIESLSQLTLIKSWKKIRDFICFCSQINRKINRNICH